LVVSADGELCREASRSRLKSDRLLRISLNSTPWIDYFALKRAVTGSRSAFVAATEVPVNSPG